MNTTICLLDLPDWLLKSLFGYLTVADALKFRLTCSRLFQISKCKEFYEKVQICRSKICSLPDSLLSSIFGYLTVTDALKLRLTCTRMFKTSKCNEFYEKMQICMSKIKVNDLDLFQELCKTFASKVRFNTEGCFEERLRWILSYVEDIKDIRVNIRYLKQACMEVKHIRQLVINFTLTDGLESSHIDFSYLSVAKELAKLIIRGTVHYYQKLVLYQPMLYDIIKHTKQISKICFDSIEVQSAKSFEQGSLSEEIKNSSHISEWSLKNVVADDGIFNLPEDIRILECRNTNCISFRDYNFEKLEKLALESVKFESRNFIFENVKILEITGQLLGGGLDGKTVICPKLEILRLLEICHITSFQNLLTGELKRLYMTVSGGIRDTEKDWILRTKPSIKKLIIIEIYDNFADSLQLKAKRKKEKGKRFKGKSKIL